MDFFKYNIKEDNWNFYIIDDDDDVVQDDDDAAVTEFDKKEVYFRKGYINQTNVRHEVWHIYMGYCYLSTAGLDDEAFEEVTAELFAHEGENIMRKAKDVLDKLEKLKKRGEKDVKRS